MVVFSIVVCCNRTHHISVLLSNHDFILSAAIDTRQKIQWLPPIISCFCSVCDGIPQIPRHAHLMMKSMRIRTSMLPSCTKSAMSRKNTNSSGQELPPRPSFRAAEVVVLSPMPTTTTTTTPTTPTTTTTTTTTPTMPTAEWAAIVTTRLRRSPLLQRRLASFAHPSSSPLRVL